jgi:hypothetical protein
VPLEPNIPLERVNLNAFEAGAHIVEGLFKVSLIVSQCPHFHRRPFSRIFFTQFYSAYARIRPSFLIWHQANAGVNRCGLIVGSNGKLLVVHHKTFPLEQTMHALMCLALGQHDIGTIRKAEIGSCSKVFPRQMWCSYYANEFNREVRRRLRKSLISFRPLTSQWRVCLLRQERRWSWDAAPFIKLGQLCAGSTPGRGLTVDDPGNYAQV